MAKLLLCSFGLLATMLLCTSALEQQPVPASPPCGDGFVDVAAGEQCEPPDFGCCSKECKFRPSGTVCRHSKHECRDADMCSGLSGKCPHNRLKPDGTKCNVWSEKNGQHYACISGHCKNIDKIIKARQIVKKPLDNDLAEDAHHTDRHDIPIAIVGAGPTSASSSSSDRAPHH